MSKYSIVLGIATRKGVTFRHQYLIIARTLRLAEAKALQKASWRFIGCGVVVEDWKCL